jgi:hypothetical protein
MQQAGAPVILSGNGRTLAVWKKKHIICTRRKPFDQPAKWLLAAFFAEIAFPLSASALNKRRKDHAAHR